MPDFYCDEVLSGRASVDVVAETSSVLAFRHTRPYYATHIVVVPKMHLGSLLDLDATDPLTGDLIAVLQDVSRMVVAERGGAHVVTNLGKFQDSGHLHFHVGAD
jgi:histidine triad (HIT) family protein